ncbi:uncharacterized protein LOC144663093 [Oculina patagonica]
MAAALQRAIERYVLTDDEVDDRDHLLVNVNSDRLRNAYHSVRLRVRDWRHNTEPAQQVLQQLSNMLNSNENFTMDDTFNMNISHVRDPGIGRGRTPKLGLDPIRTILNDKRSVVQIKNNDNMCCARALVVAKAYRDFGARHPHYRGVVRGEQEQKEAAQVLHRNAGVMEGPCGLEEIAAFQTYLRDYQIVVVSVEHGYQIIYKGPEQPETKRLVLIKHGQHYHACHSLKGFFEKSYYCLRCETGSNNRSKHSCPGTQCFACHQTDCVDYRHGGTAELPCVDCRRSFFGERCHQLHKTRQSGPGQKQAEFGKRNSVCHTHKKCLDCRKVYSGYEIKHGHQCGHGECPSCKKYQDLQTHQCYIQNPDKVAEERRNRKRRRDGSVAPPPERDPPLFVSWDAEARQDDGEHVPNLICAMANDREYSFEGEECVVHFLDWLRFLARENDVIAVAHNFQGYDSYFILNELYRQAVCPEQVVNGAKILSMSIPGITFKDSMCFMQMPLSSFPKAFGLTEQKKGFFPHFFNTRENQTYVGRLPARDYYDPEGMSKQRRDEFEIWYAEQLSEDNPFDFQQELLAYCRSDVKLLHEGCRVFREEFEEVAGFDPMEKCLTIASACSRYYNTQCLKEHTLASEPLRGWHGKGKPHSQVSLEWLHYLDSRSPTRIQHARNGGECQIFLRGHRVHVDGKDEDDVIYEFYGCFYHGCPDCFPNRDQKYSLLNRRSMREVYEETRCRAATIRAAGYTLVEMWECTWQKMKRDDERVKAFVDTLELLPRLEPRDAFFGGRTNAIQLYHQTREDEEIHYVDFTSLYPWVNKNCTYPEGHPKVILEPGHTDLSQYFGLVKCSVHPPFGLFSPVLPYRHGGKLTFPLCRTCVETEQPKPLTERSMTCSHTREQRLLTGTWCTPELEEAVRQGYTIEHVHEVWHFERRSNELFKSYVDTFLKLKQEASGWPDWVGDDEEKRQQYLDDYERQEGIRLDPDKIEKNPGKRSLAKMMLNSFWGKYGQQGNKPQVEAFTSPADFYNLLRDESVTISDIRVVNPDMLEVVHKHRDECEQVQPNVNIFVACFTTCYARLKLYQEGLARLRPHQILYFDTDSLIYRRGPADPTLPLGDFLGDFTNELDPQDYITEFAAAGPKNYGYKTRQGKVCCKVRGFSLNVRGSTQLNFETLKDNVLSEVRDPLDRVARHVPVFNPHKITRDPKTKTLHTVTEIKRYQVVFDKRVVDPVTMASYPYGYRASASL